MMSASNILQKETDMDVKARRAMERVSENMHVVANEPSLALYRLQEHVRKALPFMVEKRGEFAQLHEQLQGRTYDTDYAVSAVHGIAKAKDPFEACAASLKNTIFYRQQLRYRDSKKQSKSMYHNRLSTGSSMDPAAAAIEAVDSTSSSPSRSQANVTHQSSS